MKPLRVLLIGVGVLLLLLAVVVVLAFSSGVQTWAARRALETQPDIRGEIGRVSVGLRHVRAENLVIERPGMILRLPSLEVDMAVISAARERIDIRRVVAHGWVLDLTAPEWSTARAPVTWQAASVLPLTFGAAASTGAAQASAAIPVSDVLAALKLPVEIVRIDGVDLQGEVIFPTGDAAAPGRAQVRITGGGVAPGEEGTLQIGSQATLRDQSSPVSRLDLQSQLQIRLATPQRLERVATTSTIEAQGDQVAPGTRLFVDAVVGSAADGGRYTLQVRTPERSLFSLDARPVRPDATELAGQWTLGLSDTDLAPFSFGYTLPSFTAQGQGGVTFAASDQSMTLDGQLEAQVSRLEVVRPELSSIGSLKLDTRFGARRAGDDLRVTRLQVSLASDRPVLEVSALQGVEFNLGSGELRVADPEADLFDVKLRGLPLEWVQPFAGSYQLSGGPLQGSWLAAARDGGFTLRSTEPLRMGGLTVAEAGQVLVASLNVAMSPSFEYNRAGWQGRVERGQVQQDGRRLIEFDARAGQAAQPGAALVATTRFSADVAGLLSLPIASDYRYVQAGTAQGDVIVAMGEKVEMAGKFELTGLVANTDEVLPRLQFEVRADREPSGRIEAHVPILVTRDGRASDLTIDAQVRPDGEVMVVEALVSGDHVFVQDVQLLAAPFAATTDDAATEEPSAAPPWNGLRGKITLALGTVVYTEQLRAADVKGEIVLEPDALRVPNFRAVMATGGSMQLQAALNHRPNAAETFALQGEINASQVQVGDLLRALNPGSTPPVEGVFDFTSTLSGQAKDLGALAERAALEARLSSRGGTLRALPLRVTEVARTGGALAGLIGGLTGDSRAQRLAEGAKAAAEFAQTVGSLSFDQLNVEVARSAGGDLAVRDISVISPLVRLLGAGSIAQREGQPFWQEPLSIRLQLAARGSLATHLRTLRLLKQEQDTLGYVPMVEDFTLQGSLYDISVPQLQSLLSRALASLQSGSPPPAQPAPTGDARPPNG